MNFADSVLIRLAGTATRTAVFDDVALAQMLSAQYDTDAMPLSGPYSAVFDRLELGVSLTSPVTIAGALDGPRAGERANLSLALNGLASSTVRVDALWKGRIVARATIGGGSVDQVKTSWPDVHAIDAQIVTALGSLPADPTQLEHERRTRYMTQLQAGMSYGAALTDAEFDADLREAGVDSVGALIASGGTNAFGTISLRFAAAPATQVSTALPVSFALLVRDALSISDLLNESKSVRTLLAPTTNALDYDRNMPARFSVGVAWVVPAATFDDAAWPGSDNAARRAAAGAWLAQEGIGLVTTS
jgi:hypothetical protein